MTYARTTATTFEPVSYADWSYTMSEKDVLDRYAGGTFTDCDGPWRFEGWRYDWAKGDKVTICLDVPLCQGCDQPIKAHVCDACGVVFVGEQP